MMTKKEMTDSALPTLPGRLNMPRPSGKPGNLSVLDWAGFKSAVTYTYDDAQPSHIAHYEDLQATGARMTFYFSKNVDWIPNSDGLWARAVRDGHEIGNHTVSHPRADLTDSGFGEALTSQEAELDICTEYILEHFIQDDVWTMAYPFGDTEWREFVKERFFLCRGVNDGTIGPNGDADPYNLPCYAATDGETAEKFNGLIDSARSKGHWLIFLFHTLCPTEDIWYAPVHTAELTKSINHAQDYGDIWVDTLASIGAYWMGEKIFNSVTPRTAGEETIWRWSLPAHFPKGKSLRVKVDGGTLKQQGQILPWNAHGYYELALDAGELTLTP